jgi:ribosome-associated protein
VFDAFEVMVHLFTSENRAKYRLELLWKDAAVVPLAGLLAAPVPRKRASAAKRPKPRTG